MTRSMRSWAVTLVATAVMTAGAFALSLPRSGETIALVAGHPAAATQRAVHRAAQRLTIAPAARRAPASDAPSVPPSTSAVVTSSDAANQGVVATTTTTTTTLPPPTTTTTLPPVTTTTCPPQPSGDDGCTGDN